MAKPAALLRPKLDKKKKKSAKKEDKKKTKEKRRTKSFKIKAELVPPPVITDDVSLVSDHPHNLQQQTPTALLKKPSSITTTESDTSSEDNNNNNNSQPQPYYRGGGYHAHVLKSYQERWSNAHVDNVVRSWDMTPGQRDKLMELKERIADVDHPYLNDPHQCVYFLKDELGNVNAAEKFLRKTAQSRAASPYQFDTILTDYELPDDYDYFPMGILQGTDREGAPISFTRTGAADCWGLYRRHGKEAMIKHAIYNMEVNCRGFWQADYEKAHNGRKATQFTVIYDLQGLSMRHLRPGLIPTLSVVSRLLQDTYPELVKRVLIIRAPAIFKTVWGIVKHMFDKELRDLMMFGTEGDDSNQLMERFIDPNVLPTCLHPEGANGRVARGFEHVIMEGGLIPDEGTYTTPEYVKQGRTKEEDEAFYSDSTTQMSNLRKRSLSLTGAPPTKCDVLMKGSYDLIYSGHNNNNNCKARIQLDPATRGYEI